MRMAERMGSTGRAAWLIVTALASAPIAAAEGQPGAVDDDHRHQATRSERGPRGLEQTERLSRTVKIGPDGELDLWNVAGDIAVTGGTGADVIIDALMRARGGSEDEAKRQLSLVRVDVIERVGRVEVKTAYPRGARTLRVSVDYTVRVPSGVSVDVKSISGNIKASGIKGELRVESLSGNVSVSGAGRIAIVRSMSGDVDIASATTDGELRASTVSGSLRASGVKARGLDLGSVSGDLRLRDIVCERVNLRSVSGSLEYGGPLLANGRYALKSHSGDVRLAIAGVPGFELDANTFSGDIRSDLPITLRLGEGEPGRRSRRSIQGTHGDGSALIVVTTFSGSIVITKR